MFGINEGTLVQSAVKGFLSHIYTDLEKKGVDVAKIGPAVQKIEAELQPLVAKVELDLPQINQLFFGGKLSSGEIANVETALKDAMTLATELEPIAEEITTIAEG